MWKSNKLRENNGNSTETNLSYRRTHKYIILIQKVEFYFINFKINQFCSFFILFVSKIYHQC